MNKRKGRIILSWLLLLCFAVGQFVLYTHQHRSKYNALIVHTHHDVDKQVIQEKCSLCDQMHHAPINSVQSPDYCSILSSAARVYVSARQHYKANSLIHADGLSPPAVV